MSRAKNAGRCGRPSCNAVVDNYGYCKDHKRFYVAVGYVPASPVYERIDLLKRHGHSLRSLVAVTGLGRSTFTRRQIKTFRAEAARKIFAVPIPELWAENSRASVSAVGTVRRLQALRAIGYAPSHIADALGVTKQAVAQWQERASVSAATAVRVDELFRKWQMTPGPSSRSRLHALRRGWVTAVAWDNIDDPAEVPNMGDRVHVSASERITELQELGVHDVQKIADRLGIRPKSVERTIERNRAAA